MAVEGSDIAVRVDWELVKAQVLAKERIPPPEDSGAGKGLAKAVDECLRLAKHLVRPVVTSVRRSVVACEKGSVKIEGSVKISGAALSSYIKGSKSVHLFLATIGAGLEGEATKLMGSGDHLHGYLLDRVGSFAVESLAGGFEKGLRRAYRPKGMSVSMRFSPGYCDWPLEEQFKLVKILDFAAAGVELTKSCMMVPKKSISGLVGIGPKGRFSGRASQCGICDRKNCDFRRIAVAAGD